MFPTPTKRVSQADVARIAGVSTNTVSRVVRGDPEVSDETRRRITALLNEVNYRPNYAARSLVSKKTGVLHVVLAAPMFHGHGRTLLSVVNAATLAGFHVSMSNSWSADGRLSPQIAPFDVDGVVILGGQEPTIEAAIQWGESVPTVLLLSSEQHLDGVATVAVDNIRGAYLATMHLLRQGVTDLVHLGGPASWGDAVRRRQGYEQACAEMGIDPVVLPAESWNARDGFDAVMGMPAIASGFVCGNDQLAMGAMRAIHERGASIPRDAAVVGFDDMDGADCFNPPLTTIRQPFDRVGRNAVHQVRHMLDGQGTQDILIEPELVIRASSQI